MIYTTSCGGATSSQPIMLYNSNSSSIYYFAQFDWLDKKFYTSINSISRNLGTIFLLPAPKMYNNIDKKYDFDDKVGIIRNELFYKGFAEVYTSRKSTKIKFFPIFIVY